MPPTAAASDRISIPTTCSCCRCRGSAAGASAASQTVTSAAGRAPASLQAFAIDAVARLVGDPDALGRALGEWLSEPKPSVCFDAGAGRIAGPAVRLDRRTRMLYDDHHVFING